MRDYIKTAINNAIEEKQKLRILENEIEQTVQIIVECLRQGGKILLCGNGGSAADAQHIAAEFIGLLNAKNPRISLPALALTINPSIITAISNDFSFEEVFARQIEGLGNKNDVLIAISTSGNSKNVIKAIETAKAKGMKVVGLTGNDGGQMNNLSLDCLLKAPSNEVNRIQEMHITVGHILCGAVEKELFN